MLDHADADVLLHLPLAPEPPVDHHRLPVLRNRPLHAELRLGRVPRPNLTPRSTLRVLASTFLSGGTEVTSEMVRTLGTRAGTPCHRYCTQGCCSAPTMTTNVPGANMAPGTFLFKGAWSTPGPCVRVPAGGRPVSRFGGAP